MQSQQPKIEELRLQLYRLQEPDAMSRTIQSTELLLDLFDEAQPLLEFETSIFKSLVEKIMIYPQRFCFKLKNGLVIEERRCQK
ncbi:MAG: hypothetical protein ACLSB9_29385 [Hydrogeniiclostridium mannosilyticum]